MIFLYSNCDYITHPTCMHRLIGISLKRFLVRNLCILGVGHLMVIIRLQWYMYLVSASGACIQTTIRFSG